MTLPAQGNLSFEWLRHRSFPTGVALRSRRPRVRLACGRQSAERGRKPLKSKAKVDPAPPACSVKGCTSPATILHRGQPYCGKDALALLEGGEAPDRPADFLQIREMR